MPHSAASSLPEPAEPDLGPAARSPFIRLNDLLAPITPGKPAISLAIGEPQHAMPDFVGRVLADNLAGFGRYPTAKGIPAFRQAAAAWLDRRYSLPRPVDPEREVLVLNGSREGLFSAAILARKLAAERKKAPVVLMPNPFYAAYGAGAEAAGCEAVAMPTRADTGWLPDIDAIDDALFARTTALYIASPANPQGAVASRGYLARLIARARSFGTMIFADECYSEVWLGDTPPPGVLEVAGDDFTGVVAFNSLSKRSSLPGLRCGFCAGDPAFLERFTTFRNVAAPQVPEPIQAVGVAALNDEAHVIASRDLYKAKFDIADRIIGNRFGYTRPEGGFFLWLDVSHVGGGEAAAKLLWEREGLRTIPGGYLARSGLDGINPALNYLRAALVQPDLATTEEALTRLKQGLS